MGLTTSRTISLSDLANHKIAEWYVVYFDRERPLIFPQRWLKKGFKHIELCRRVSIGPGPQDAVWLLLLPTSEMLQVELWLNSDPPWKRYPGLPVQKVTTVRPYFWMRSRWEIGPFSCVEAAKSALGIRAFWVRTPYQLYRYIKQRGGVI